MSGTLETHADLKKPFPRNFLSGHYDLLRQNYRSGDALYEALVQSFPVSGEAILDGTGQEYKTDEEYKKIWIDGETMGFHLTPNNWFRIAAPILGMRCFCLLNGIPYLPLGTMELKYEPPPTLCKLLKNIVDGNKSKGWPYVISLAKATFEVPPQNSDSGTPHVFQLLETATRLFRDPADNIRFNISVTAFCIAAAKLGVFSFPKKKNNDEACAWVLLVDTLVAKSGCDAFSSLILKLKNDTYLAEHFDPRPWQLPLHLFLSCTPIAILETKRLFSSHISRLHLLQMAQVLDPLERPRVVKSVESVIKSAVVALSNCTISVDAALTQIFEDTSHLIVDVSPADSFFFFTNLELTPPSTEAQHPPCTSNDSPRLAPPEPHSEPPECHSLLPSVALGSIPVGLTEATPVTPSTPARLLLKEAHFPTPLSPLTPFISLSLSTPPRSPPPGPTPSIPLSPELTPPPPELPELTPSIPLSPDSISLPLPTSPILRSPDPTRMGLLVSEDLSQAPPEPTSCLPDDLNLVAVKPFESSAPQDLALASSRYLKLLLDSEWRQYCGFFDQNEDYARKVLDQVFVALEEAKNIPLRSRIEDHPVHLKGFLTMRPDCWLNDAVMTHFAYKWAKKAPRHDTLCLETWYPSHFLFKDSACRITRSHLEGVSKLTHYVQKLLSSQRIQVLNHCFVTVNEASSHWYAACIAFEPRSIQVYDSLCSPARGQKIMPGLIWLATVLASFRGESESESLDWETVFCGDVLKQGDAFSCGLHVLYYLKHVLKFGEVRHEDSGSPISFTDNMVGKRVQLVDDLLKELQKRYWQTRNRKTRNRNMPVPVISCPIPHLAERALPPPPLSVLLAHTDLPTTQLRPLLAHTDLPLSGPQRSSSKSTRVHPYPTRLTPTSRPSSPPTRRLTSPIRCLTPPTRRPSSPLTATTSDDERLDGNVGRLGSGRPTGIGHETLDALRGRMGWSEDEFTNCRKKLKVLVEKYLPPLSFTNQDPTKVQKVKDKECPRFLEQEGAWGLDNLFIRACKNHHDKHGEASASTPKDNPGHSTKTLRPRPD
ncbi:hypothetical protein BDP27DRAFT_1427513 [Rhodocollybia butyracea]|uniref:Ubiquitin-like protease family profile domain-containing protein n=1 Tax=Rhodocollybia butyracea TaxID=206335 RepID=A0A9P5PIT2_9AGAR|nr:hypothetical protein BDP27DRAFT_1427513 [Rhodocollybia butyracea]